MKFFEFIIKEPVPIEMCTGRELKGLGKRAPIIKKSKTLNSKKHYLFQLTIFAAWK
jgi:hypothetical protein